MRLNEEIFRMYDIRGIADVDLDEEFAYKLGLAYSIYVGGSGNVCVGGDVRTTTEKYKRALIDGLRDGGLNVIDIGIVPTPLMYFSLFNLDVVGGIQVTASHNPKEYNGFKIAIGKETIYGEQIQKLKIIIQSDIVPSKIKGNYEFHNIAEKYIEFLKERFKFEKSFNLVIDTGNGVVGYVIPQILEALNIKYKGLFIEPDGNFPNHLPDPTVVKYMKWAIDEVKNGSYDGAFGYDGDGDRIGIVDEKGNLIFGDKITAIIAKGILRKYKNAKIILDVKCSKGVVEYIQKLGGEVILYKTGHSLMKAKLKELNSPLAGEMSGHIFIKDDFFGYDDAIYSSLRFLKEVEISNKSFSEIFSEIPFYYSTPEIRVEVEPESKKFEIVDELVKKFKEKNYNVIDIDGARIEFDDGFILVRASNTQPVLVLRFEAKTEEKLNLYQNLLYEELRNYKEFVKI
ncbi:MAG: phosphomannomutase/phosphoglucomutase [candidate division WOR-3 bacterium]|jgi:phosphomannomutase/phosphoglucomutase